MGGDSQWGMGSCVQGGPATEPEADITSHREHHPSVRRVSGGVRPSTPDPDPADELLLGGREPCSSRPPFFSDDARARRATSRLSLGHEKVKNKE